MCDFASLCDSELAQTKWNCEMWMDDVNMEMVVQMVECNGVM